MPSLSANELDAALKKRGAGLSGIATAHPRRSVYARTGLATSGGCLSGRSRVVEAAGVEPASESTSSRDSTCVSASRFSCPACGSGEEPPGTRPGTSHLLTPSRRPETSLINGVRPPTLRRGPGERHCLIKQRERTDCPQLTDVPSDLRVNRARHASRNPVPPSKPNSPP